MRSPGARQYPGARYSAPPLLAIDTSTRTVGLALYDGVQVLSEAVWTSQDHHTVELAPAIAETLQKCGVPAAELGALAVATGPGSFTGLRIGLALAKGMCLVQRLPLIGIPTLDVLAAAQPICGPSTLGPSTLGPSTLGPSSLGLQMAAVLRAGRGRLAVGLYHVEQNAWRPSRSIEVLTPADLAQRIQIPTLVCGELTKEERQLLERKHKNVLLATPAQSLRRPSYLAELAWQRWQAGQVDDPASLAPIYLHYNDPIPG